MFGQLVSYLNRRDTRSDVALCHNLFAAEDDPGGVVEELTANARYLAERKNGVGVYHEILSLEGRGDVPVDRQGEILLDIAEHYLALRAPEQLAYGRVHMDTAPYTHLHLVISSNRPRSSRRERLSKASFRNIQIELERYQLERYPELGERRLYGRQGERTHDRLNIGTREYEVARREGRAPLKAALCELLAPELAIAHSYNDLAERVASAGYRLYERGDSWGVENVETGRRHRLKTLGLAQDASAAKERFALLRERQDSLAHERAGTNQAGRELHDHIAAENEK